MCAHGYDDKRNGKNELRDEPTAARGKVCGCPGLFFFPEVVLVRIRRQIGSREAQLAYAFADRLNEGVKSLTVRPERAFSRTNLGCTVGKAHGSAVHYVHLVQRTLRTSGARAAEHAFYTETKYVAMLFHNCPPYQRRDEKGTRRKAGPHFMRQVSGLTQ